MSITRRVACSATTAFVVVILIARSPALSAQRSQRTAGEESYSARCGVGGSESANGSYVPLPRGDVFCPLIADPKATQSFVAYQRGNDIDLATDIAAVGIADQFPFFRAAAFRPGNGIQLGLAGAVFAQFDLDSASYDLLNADYTIGLPLTFRAGPISGRVRPYHQSSHLGDEFLLRPNPPQRQNISFEAVEGLLSIDVSALRVYGGGESYLRRDPIDLPDRLWHGGAELRPQASVDFGPFAVARFVAASDVKVVGDTTTRTGVSVRAGFEFARPGDEEIESRRWSLMAEYYRGPSPYGQFFRQLVRLSGVGLHFTL